MADSSQVKEITAKLEQGVKDLFNSDTYADYLRTMSRFHKYSTRNTLLIHMQKPNAMLVAGFQSWKTKFERHVKKDEKAIKILAPVPFTKREEKEKLDPETRKPIIDEHGMPVIEVTEQRFIAKFNIVNVYDVQQTDGKPLPSLVQDLTGNVEQYEAFMDALRAVSPLPIVFEPMEEGHDGTCHFGDRIAIREGMSEVQTVCAVIHELTHATIHDIETLRLADENAVPKDRHTEELEAESVSYSICSYYNIETGANSFGYIVEWSKGRELKELNASLDTIRKTAAELIDAIDSKFQEIVKDRNITFAIAEQQAELTEPIQTANDNPPVPEVAASVDRPRAGAVYGQYCNQISDTVTLDEAYANAILNSDEQNARTECEAAIKRIVLGLLSESLSDHVELYRQYTENLDFRERLEDYVFMRTYLEPRTAQRNAVRESTAPDTDISTIMAMYARNAEVSDSQRVGAVVLMTPLFDDGNVNRNGKKIRVTVEEPAGKYQLYSRDEGGDKMYYFLTASGRIDNTAGYFRSEWDAQQQKRVYPKPTEAELDGLLPMIAERFELDMADPTKWALYQHAAVLNRLDECEAHNAPVRELRNAESARRREKAERERQAEQQQKLEKYDTRVDEIAKAIEKGEVINVAYNEYEFDGKNPVLDLFKLYDISLPLRTQGWINTGLAEITNDSYSYYSSKYKGDSNAFGKYLLKLRQIVREIPIEQKRESPANPDNTVKEAIKIVEINLYEKFTELFPRFMSGEFSSMRLEAEYAKPLTLEWVFGDMISITHSYELDGKSAYEPMIMLNVNSAEKTMTGNMFEVSDPPRIDIVYDDKGHANIGMQNNINNFLSQWLEKIETQGFKPVSATVELDKNGNISKEGLITDKTVQITFDEDGNPIIPEQENKLTELDLSLPDPTIGFSEMNLYGYAGNDMFPLTNGRAAELFDTYHCIYLLYPDNTEAMALDRDEILNHDGLCGIESADWESSPVRAAQLAVVANAEGNRESELLYGGGNKFGIYQIRDVIDEARNFRFAPMRELEALGLPVDRNNYELVYIGNLDIRDTQTNLHKIFKEFNEDERPADYTGRSVSVSDVIVLQWRGDISSHFVDSVGFVKLDAFLGNENQNTPAVETFSQVGRRSEEYKGASVAEFEADVKAGKTISLLDFSKAINDEKNNNNRPSAPKTKATLMERLEEGKRKAAQNGQPDAQKSNQREV